MDKSMLIYKTKSKDKFMERMKDRPSECKKWCNKCKEKSENSNKNNKCSNTHWLIKKCLSRPILTTSNLHQCHFYLTQLVKCPVCLLYQLQCWVGWVHHQHQTCNQEWLFPQAWVQWPQHSNPEWSALLAAACQRIHWEQWDHQAIFHHSLTWTTYRLRLGKWFNKWELRAWDHQAEWVVAYLLWRAVAQAHQLDREEFRSCHQWTKFNRILV